MRAVRGKTKAGMWMQRSSCAIAFASDGSSGWLGVAFGVVAGHGDCCAVPVDGDGITFGAIVGQGEFCGVSVDGGAGCGWVCGVVVGQGECCGVSADGGAGSGWVCSGSEGLAGLRCMPW